MNLSQFENTLSLFNDFVNEMLPEPDSQWRPALSIHDEQDRFVIACDLPGVDVDELHLDVHDGILEISGERLLPVTTDEVTLRANERASGKFRRRVRLDDAVNKDAIEADYRDGVLYVAAPRMEDTMPRRIDVRTHATG